MSNPDLLVYIKEYFKCSYEPLFSKLGGFDVGFLTDFPTSGMISTRDDFNSAMSKAESLPPIPFDEEDVIARCRLLRHLQPDHAQALVRAMHATLLPVINARSWCAIVGPTVDDYVTHLLALLAEERDIPYLGLCSSYFPGYSQLTAGAEGSAIPIRDVSDAEVEKALASVSGQDFRQDYNILVRYGPAVHMARVMRYWMKRTAFFAMRYMHRYPWYFNYRVQPFAAQQKRLSDFPTAVCFSADWESRLRSAELPIVYIPLSFVPECSTDYWIRDRRFINYEDTMIEVISLLAEHYIVLIKEHFHMSGIRDKRFYQKLLSLQNVISVPPGVNSNQLLIHADKVVVGGGSVGVEAALREKNVFSYCSNTYWFEASGAEYLPVEDVSSWPASLERQPVGPESKREFVRQCLGTMLPFDYLDIESHDPRALGSFLKNSIAMSVEIA